MILEILKKIAKFPFISEGEFFNSYELKQNRTCLEKCKEKECILHFQKKNDNCEYVCSKEYNNIYIKLNGLNIIFNGLIFTTNQVIPKGRKEVRKDWIVTQDAVKSHIQDIKSIESSIDKCIDETFIQNFSMFHDFKTSMAILFSCTQDIVNKLPGEKFTDKLEQSDKSYKDLFNALELITSQLRMMDVILNPESIVFGKKKSINIFQLFDKIIKLFNHLSTKKKDINLKLIREDWVCDSMCYESIEFIPLILIDNALKYSITGSDIEIKFEQNHSSVNVIIKSVGPIVSDGNQEKIFDKFFRDQSAKEFSKEGIGMGLWIAQQILNAHDSKLNYYKDSKSTRAIGLNIFAFDLPTIPDKK